MNNDENKIEKLKKKVRKKNQEILSMRNCIFKMNARLVELLEENQNLKEEIRHHDEIKHPIAHLDENSGCVRRNFNCDDMFRHMKTSLTFYKSFFINENQPLSYHKPIPVTPTPTTTPTPPHTPTQTPKKSISFRIPSDLIDHFIDDADCDYEDSDDDTPIIDSRTMTQLLPDSPETT